MPAGHKFSARPWPGRSASPRRLGTRSRELPPKGSPTRDIYIPNVLIDTIHGEWAGVPEAAHLHAKPGKQAALASMTLRTVPSKICSLFQSSWAVGQCHEDGDVLTKRGQRGAEFATSYPTTFFPALRMTQGKRHCTSSKQLSPSLSAINYLKSMR